MLQESFCSSSFKFQVFSPCFFYCPCLVLVNYRWHAHYLCAVTWKPNYDTVDCLLFTHAAYWRCTSPDYDYIHAQLSTNWTQKNCALILPLLLENTSFYPHIVLICLYCLWCALCRLLQIRWSRNSRLSVRSGRSCDPPAPRLGPNLCTNPSPLRLNHNQPN